MCSLGQRSPEHLSAVFGIDRKEFSVGTVFTYEAPDPERTRDMAASPIRMNLHRRPDRDMAKPIRLFK
jgi:hypothetical protein